MVQATAGVRTILLALVAACAASGAAGAAPLSGSFSGIASQSSFSTAHGTVDIDGSAVSGRFSVDPSGAIALFGDASSRGYVIPLGQVTYTFVLPALGETHTFGSRNADGFLGLSDDGTTQTAVLAASIFDPHLITTLVLSGPEGSLFAAVDDPGSLHAGPGVSLVSPIYLGIHLEGSALITVTSTAIPEPAGWLMLSPALLLAVAVRRRGPPLSRARSRPAR